MKKLLTPLVLLMALLVSFSAFSLPKLNSYPTASATIYLDFDGYDVNSAVWNGGTAFTCAAANMTDAQVTEVFNRVSEDYRPFNINITTDEATFLAAPLAKRIRVVITPTSGWYTGVGGVSYVGSFTWGDDTPCFVFSDRLGPKSAKMVGECCSHESGHSVGLSHQSKYDTDCNLTAVYNEGNGSGQVAWAPIMGNSYYRNMSSWTNGPTPYGCGDDQDNLSIITTRNGFSFRTDDYNDISNSPAQITLSNTPIQGVITTANDRDAFRLSLPQNATVHLNIDPYSVGSSDNGANLDVRMQLFDAAKNLIRVYDPKTTMSIEVDTVLSSGDYYIVIDGTGNDNTNDYGSLGSYAFRGVAGGILPIRSVSLNGIATNNKHDLNWTIISDDPIQSITVESSADGTGFTSISTTNTSDKNFSYTPASSSDLYYRLKVISITGQTIYSNIIKLKTGKQNNTFSISTFIHNEIQLSAAGNFSYQLNDINGRVTAKGNGRSGSNKINVERLPSGIYILQLISNNERKTERIIKQ